MGAFRSGCLAKVPDGMSAKQVVKLWMDSEGHRANILNQHPNKGGVGATWDEDQNCWFITLNFVRN